MGQKVNPIGFRIQMTRDWRSRWYAGPKEYTQMLHEDLKIRDFLKKKLEQAAVPRINIERASQRLRVTIFTARPGIVIGRKGSEIDKLKEDIASISSLKEVYVDIQEIKTPETNAQLIAENVALQLERRISFRRAMKKAAQTAMDFGAHGVKIRSSGRLGGSEIARSEWHRLGKIPLHTIRANIDYGFAEACTTYGKIGVKAWIFREAKKDEETSKIG